MRWLLLLGFVVMGCQSPEPQAALPAPQPPTSATDTVERGTSYARTPERPPAPSDTVITAHVEAMGALFLPEYTASVFGDGTVRFSVEAEPGFLEYKVPPRDVAALVAAFVEDGFFDLDDQYSPLDSMWAFHFTTVALSMSLDSRWKRVTSIDRAGPASLDSLTRRFFRVSRVDSVVVARRDSLYQQTKPPESKPFWEWPTPSNPHSQPTPG